MFWSSHQMLMGHGQAAMDCLDRDGQNPPLPQDGTGGCGAVGTGPPASLQHPCSIPPAPLQHPSSSISCPPAPAAESFPIYPHENERRDQAQHQCQLLATSRVQDPKEEGKCCAQKPQGNKNKGRSLLLPSPLSGIDRCLDVTQSPPLRCPSPCRVMLK